MNKKLVVEINHRINKVVNLASRQSVAGGAGMVTPLSIGDDDYWVYRVRLSETQAVVAFPKFYTIGIGFAQETDWNTNLPYQCGAEEIYRHIEHNKGDSAIADADVKQAIRMLKDAIETNLTQDDIERLNGW